MDMVAARLPRAQPGLAKPYLSAGIRIGIDYKLLMKTHFHLTPGRSRTFNLHVGFITPP
jgi:hypothetical protein